MLQGAIIGFAVALGIMIWNRLQARSGAGLAGSIERAMRGKGPMNIKSITTLVGKTSFFGRGQVVQALIGLQGAKKLKTTPAPPGTPQLQKVDHILYEVI